MGYSEELKKKSDDSAQARKSGLTHPTIYKTIGGTTYIARIQFNKSSELNIDDKLRSLMGKELKHLE